MKRSLQKAEDPETVTTLFLNEKLQSSQKLFLKSGLVLVCQESAEKTETVIVAHNNKRNRQ